MNIDIAWGLGVVVSVIGGFLVLLVICGAVGAVGEGVLRLGDAAKGGSKVVQTTALLAIIVLIFLVLWGSMYSRQDHRAVST